MWCGTILPGGDQMESVTGAKRYILGLQHTMAMFGATVLVPLLTGIHPSIALLTAGLGTLLFHMVTKRKVPVFLGSSFAFIAAIQLVGRQQGLRYRDGRSDGGRRRPPDAGRDRLSVRR